MIPWLITRADSFCRRPNFTDRGRSRVPAVIVTHVNYGTDPSLDNLVSLLLKHWIRVKMFKVEELIEELCAALRLRQQFPDSSPKIRYLRYGQTSWKERKSTPEE